MSRKRILQYQEQTIILNNCRSLVLIDSAPLKQAEQKKCKEIILKMDLAREQLRIFHEESQPSFMQWLNMQFGKEIKQLRELAEKAQKLERLVCEVDEYKHFAECTYYEAYQFIMNKRKNTDLQKDASEETEEVFNTGFENVFGSRKKWKGSKQEYDSLYEEYKKIYHSFSSTTEDFDEGDDDAPIDLNNHQFSENRLKALYRSLARKLHPDVNDDLDLNRKNLWHQVQDAYEAKDLNRLETLSTMSEAFENNTCSVASVWSLKVLNQELKEGLKYLKKKIKECSKELAWDFAKHRKEPKKLNQLYNKISFEMERDRSELTKQIQSIETFIHQWKQKPHSRRLRKK